MASAPAAAMLGARARTGWWQWLLLTALLLLILAALAYVVRPYLPHLEAQLEAEARERALAMSVRAPLELQQARVDTLRQDNERLRLELAELTDRMAQKGGDCSAGVLGPGGVIVGVVPGAPNQPIERGPGDKKDPDVNLAEKADDKDKRPDAKADKGPTPQDKAPQDKGPQDQPKDAANDPANKDKKDEPKPMKVPPEAKQKQELAFLKGDWRSRNGLASASGEKDLHPSYTLDDKGKGKVTFTQQNGATCEAPAEAHWDNGKLMIEEKSNPQCSDGRTYARNIVNCDVGQDGTAQCSGSQPGDKRSYDVQIGR